VTTQGPFVSRYGEKAIASIPDTGPDTPYVAYKRNIGKYVLEFLQPDRFGVMPAERVARAVFRAGTVRRPRTRYNVGFWAKFGPIGRAMTPDRVVGAYMTREIPLQTKRTKTEGLHIKRTYSLRDEVVSWDQRLDGPEPKKCACASERFVARSSFPVGYVARSICIMSDLDLVNWTMQEARQLSPDHQMHREDEGMPSLDNVLFGVLEGERGEPSEDIRAINVHSVQLTVGSPITSLPSEVPERPKPNTASDLPAYTQAAPSAPADVRAAQMSPLLKAIVEPDIYTAPADRERAIILRWVLRDIKANRLKLSPVDQHNLRELIDMGLVEMRNDAPVLTNAGVNAIV
jgi:hypothetical protein